MKVNKTHPDKPPLYIHTLLNGIMNLSESHMHTPTNTNTQDL